MEGKGKGVLDARETRGERDEGGKEVPFLLARPVPRVSLAPKTPFPFPSKRLPRRLHFPQIRTLQIFLLLGSKPGNNINIVIDTEVVVIVVVSTDCLKLRGVSMDRQLRFHDHISITYKKSSQRVGFLMELRNFYLLVLVLIYSFLKLQFFPT